MKKLLLLLTASVALAACGTTEEVETIPSSSNVSSQVETAAVINLVVEGEKIDEMTTEIEEGDTLLNVTKENYDVQEADGFVSAINGFEQDEEANLWWTYTINGEVVNVGANDYELQPGDTAEWSLTAFEE